MRMNALIPLQGQYADPVGAFARGQGARAQSDEYAHLNALRGAYKQHGGAAMQGDQNALAAIAQYDPAQAMGLRTAQHGMQATDERTDIMRQNLALQRAAGAREAQRLAAQMDADQRAAAAAELQAASAPLLVAFKNGPEAWDAANDSDPRFENVPFERAPYELAKVFGAIEALMPAEPDMPSSVREYNFAKEQGFEGTLAEWKGIDKPETNVNTTVNSGSNAWDNESAKLFAQRYDQMTAAASNARDMLGMYDLAEAGLNTGVRTGFGAETELAIRQLGASLGIGDADKLAGGELVKSVQNRMALAMRNPDSGMGMPGAVSDRDIQFLKDSQIGIDRSEPGNRAMLEAFRRLETRKVEIAQLADQYIQEKGRLDPGFNAVVREFAETNPLFADGLSIGGKDASQEMPQKAIDAGIDPDLWQYLDEGARDLWK